MGRRVIHATPLLEKPQQGQRLIAMTSKAPHLPNLTLLVYLIATITPLGAQVNISEAKP